MKSFSKIIARKKKRRWNKLGEKENSNDALYSFQLSMYH